jgi:3-dehydroquinate synthase
MQIISSGYTIHHGDSVFASLNNFITENYANHSLVVLVDDNTFELCLPLLAKHSDAIANADVIEIPSGESNKTLANIAHIWDTLTGLGNNRKTLFINLGGGLVSDMGGFAAATFKRGLDFINIPTTLLSMVDASVGGKTGFDFNGIKNQIGLFANPKAVFILPDFLATLPERQLYSGFAEMLKHGIIADATLWDNLKQIAPTADSIAPYIAQSLQIKNSIILTDPYDANLRRALNYGHTFGHAIESNFIDTDDELLHGEAIAIGMVCEAFIAMEKGLISPAVLKDIEEHIAPNFNFITLDADDEENISALMLHDKKNTNDFILAALPNAIGSCLVDVEITPDDIKKALHYYKALSY